MVNNHAFSLELKIANQQKMLFKQKEKLENFQKQKLTTLFMKQTLFEHGWRVKFTNNY
jgi:hypothetical protein